MNPSYPPAVPARRRPGCLFYGCLTLGILALVLGGALGIGLYYGVKKFNQTVIDYTAAEPMELPITAMPDPEYAALEQRFQTFTSELRDGRAETPLVLSSEDINALINRNQAMEEWRGRVHVRMEDNEVRGQVSLPLDPLAQGPILKQLRGRYLNGAARLGIGMEAGRLAVRLLAMEVNDRTIPVEIMQRISSLNLAEGANDNPESASLFARIREVKVEDGNLVITPLAAP